MKNERKRKILQFVSSYINENGFSPTIREIQTAVGVASTATVYKDLQQLCDEGLITMGGWGSPRTIRVVSDI